MASATGSSRRNRADLLILAQTIEVVLMHQFDDEVDMGADDRDRGLVDRHGVGDLRERQCLDLFGVRPSMSAKARLANMIGAVLRHGQHGHRKPLQNH